MRSPNDNLKYNLMCHLSILTEHCSIVLSISLLIRPVTVTEEFGNFFKRDEKLNPRKVKSNNGKHGRKLKLNQTF